MYEAVILAAGYSSRIGSNKMILSIDEKPMLCHVVEAFYPLCHKIHVVSGHYHADIVALLSQYEKVHIIYNNDYHLGMFSSLLCGIEQVTGDCFICPGRLSIVTNIGYSTE
jgi:molybdenum cofactor cytidylyltransferase